MASWVSVTIAVRRSGASSRNASSGHESISATPGKRACARERRARIDDGDVEAREGRHLGERLRDVHRADQDESHGRLERLHEPASTVDLPESTGVARERFRNHRFECGQRRGVAVVRMEQPLRAVVESGDQRGAATGGAIREQRVEQRALHSTRSTKTFS